MNKRILPLILAAALALCLSAPLAAHSEAQAPVKATIFFANARVESDLSDLTKAYLKETFGFDFELITGVDNWQQKYALLVSGGDIPALSVIPAANFYEYAAQGAYIDLTDKVKEYPNIMDYVDETNWPRVSVGGRIYAVPGNNTAGKWNYSIRKDWLDKLGLGIPSTYDEFVEVLRAFTEDDPDGNGVNDTYGYGNSNLNMFYGMFGQTPGYYTVKDGVIEIGSISEGYKQALIATKELYDKGYIDPEVFTQMGEQFWQKLAQGKIGSWAAWWSELSGAYGSYAFAENNPGGELIGVPAIPGPDGTVGMPAQDPMDNVLAISYKFEDADRLLTYIDWSTTDYGYRVSRYGPEGKGFTLKPDGSLDYLWIRDPEHKLADGSKIEGDPEVFCYINRIDIYPEMIMGDAVIQQKSYEGYVMARDNPLLHNAFLGLTTEEFQTLMPDVTKYVDEMRLKFLLGDESFDNWDAYVKEYIRLGGLDVAESLLKEYNNQYQADAVIKQY
jgi:ABC-type glycerol-3-phosphate transport system substrate-binding protein